MSIKVISKNRKAFHNYEIMTRYEAGLVLQGTEVKSLRNGQANFKDSYARIENGEVILYGFHISAYDKRGYADHNPTRPRKLLLNRREIRKLQGSVEEKGLTLVPLKIYFKRGLAKIEIGLARGKKTHDKRAALSKRDSDMDIRRSIKMR